MLGRKHEQQSNSGRTQDAGRLSLWLNEDGQGKHCASGIITIGDEQFRVYLYENDKQSDSSPDYYGFIKEYHVANKPAPIKRSRTNHVNEEQESNGW